MKNFKKTVNHLALMLVMVISCVVFTGCVRTEITGTLIGKAVVNPSTVKVGDDIELSIDLTARVTQTVGKVKITAHYSIDEKSVASSTDEKNNYKTQYKVEGMKAGEHTLSVKITTDADKEEFPCAVTPVTFIVEQ